jgi:DNA-3-methyladenine glycosylase I
VAEPVASGAVPGPDGVPRCPWAAGGPEDYREYHDAEWGRPVRTETGLFERLALEGFQSGLAWLTILRKRPAFRRAFAGFDPERVAAFTDADVEALLGDPGIVRHRGKVRATVTNARAVLALRERVPGGLPEVLAQVAAQLPDPPPVPRTAADVPATTPASTALAKALAGHGFSFVGPRTAYALLQACGYVDDHLAGCAYRGAP